MWFFDFNGDGIENGDDVGYPDLTLTITGDVDGDGNDETFTVVTDANGDYSFAGLPQAEYTVALTSPAGTAPTFDADGTGTPNASTVTLTPGTPSSLTQDFGLRGTGTVGDTIFFDENGDGIQNGAEDGIPGVTVTIEVDLDGDGDSDFTTTAITDPDGKYSFGNLPAGDVTVTVTNPAGTSPTTDHDATSGGDNGGSFSDANRWRNQQWRRLRFPRHWRGWQLRVVRRRRGWNTRRWRTWSTRRWCRLGHRL